MSELPTVKYSEPLPYMKIEDMVEARYYKDSQIYNIQTMETKHGMALRVIFKFVHNDTEAYANYICSPTYSDNSKLGQLILMVEKGLPKDLNLNEFLPKAKTFWFKVLIEAKNNYPTVTKIEGVKEITQPLQSYDTESKPVTPTVTGPTLCFYCSQPLPPNEALHIPILFKGEPKKLCPNCKDHIKELIS